MAQTKSYCNSLALHDNGPTMIPRYPHWRFSEKAPLTWTRLRNGRPLVFAGGGSLGAVQVGMLRAQFAIELRPDFVVGSSVGAINEVYLAANPTPDGVADLEALRRSVRRRDVFSLFFTRLAALLFHPDYVAESDGLRAIIERRLPYASLQDARIPMHIIATDQQGTCVVLRRARPSRPFSPARRFPESIRRRQSTGIG
jgi:NTE family protein